MVWKVTQRTYQWPVHAHTHSHDSLIGQTVIYHPLIGQMLSMGTRITLRHEIPERPLARKSGCGGDVRELPAYSVS